MGSLYQHTYASDDGLVLYLPFSEGQTSSTATTAYDRSSYGNDGTTAGMPMNLGSAPTSTNSGWSTTTCKAGTCMAFDGENDYVDAGSGVSLSTTNALTLEVWLRGDAFLANDHKSVAGKSTSFTTNKAFSLYTSFV